MNKIGSDAFHIELIENRPCNNKDELRKREGELIRELGTLNARIEKRTNKQYREEHKEKLTESKRIYAQEHKDQLSEYKKEWYEKNKEAVIARVKAHAEANRDQKLEYYKKRYEEQKIIIERKSRMSLWWVL